MATLHDLVYEALCDADDGTMSGSVIDSCADAAVTATTAWLNTFEVSSPDEYDLLKRIVESARVS